MTIHASHCQGGDCDDSVSFECEICHRVVGACLGIDDDMPDACDDCWEKAHEDQVPSDVTTLIRFTQ